MKIEILNIDEIITNIDKNKENKYKFIEKTLIDKIIEICKLYNYNKLKCNNKLKNLLEEISVDSTTYNFIISSKIDNIQIIIDNKLKNSILFIPKRKHKLNSILDINSDTISELIIIDTFNILSL